MQRAKGKRLELEAASALERVTGQRWRRGAMNGVRDGPDVISVSMPWSVEVKGRATLALEQWMQQASRRPGLPIVLAREDRCSWIICVRLDHLHELLQMLHPPRLETRAETP